MKDMETEYYKFGYYFYDVIPEYCLGKKILDVGAREGGSQLKSKNREYFKSEGYFFTVDKLRNTLHTLHFSPFFTPPVSDPL